MQIVVSIIRYWVGGVQGGGGEEEGKQIRLNSMTNSEILPIVFIVNNWYSNYYRLLL